jgi:hypothetical protein
VNCCINPLHDTEQQKQQQIFIKPTEANIPRPVHSVVLSSFPYRHRNREGKYPQYVGLFMLTRLTSFKLTLINLLKWVVDFGISIISSIVSDNTLNKWDYLR